jgi:hypothetical protein
VDRPSDSIEIVIAGRGGEVTAKSLLEAVRNLLLGVNHVASQIDPKAKSGGWRVIAVSMQSPLRMALEPRSAAHRATVQRGVREFIRGCQAMERAPTTFPPYFDEAAVRAGLALATLGEEEAPQLAIHFEDLDMRPGRALGAAITALLGPTIEPYEESGTVRGSLDGLFVHVVGREKFFVFDGLTDRQIECRFDAGDLERVKRSLRKRVEVRGRVEYGEAGEPIRVTVTDWEEIPDTRSLPLLSAFRIDVTHGEDPEDYVRRLRDAE